MIVEVIDGLARTDGHGDAEVESAVAERVGDLCKRFPIYDAG